MCKPTYDVAPMINQEPFLKKKKNISTSKQLRNTVTTLIHSLQQKKWIYGEAM